MKKISISLLTFCSVFAMTLFPIDVHAIDFEGKEDQYIKICLQILPILIRRLVKSLTNI